MEIQRFKNCRRNFLLYRTQLVAFAIIEVEISLESAELLQRRTCPTDRWGTFAVLTPAGLAMQQRMWQIYSQSIAEDFACHLDDADVTVMAAALSRILAADPVKNRAVLPD